MSITTFDCDVGDRVRVRATFTDVDTDEPVDPDEVFFAYQFPNAVAVTLTYGTDAEIVRESAGVYAVQIDADSPGRVQVRAWSTGTAMAAEAGQVLVASHPLA
jgi:hypothetical protein